LTNVRSPRDSWFGSTTRKLWMMSKSIVNSFATKVASKGNVLFMINLQWLIKLLIVIFSTKSPKTTFPWLKERIKSMYRVFVLDTPSWCTNRSGIQSFCSVRIMFGWYGRIMYHFNFYVQYSIDLIFALSLFSTCNIIIVLVNSKNYFQLFEFFIGDVV